MRTALFIGLIFFAGTAAVHAQHAPDSTIADSSPISKNKKVLFQPNPKKAALYSAILPGLGQAYNRQYWKVPVIYAGIGASGYFIFYNLDQYRTYKNAYIGRLNNPNPTDEFINIYSTDALRQLQDGYKRYLDITILLTAVGYTVQVLDALAFAHLRNFDISRDISLQVRPVIVPGGAGVGVAMHFR